MREWLEHQAVGGIVDVADAEDPALRRYSLPAEHAEVLLDRDSLDYVAPFARMMVGMVRPVPALLEAFRTGKGIPYSDYPADFVEGCRIEAARQLLETTDLTVAAVAVRTGIGTPETLHRAFLRRMRITPADYRDRFHSRAT